MIIHSLIFGLTSSLIQPVDLRSELGRSSVLCGAIEFRFLESGDVEVHDTTSGNADATDSEILASINASNVKWSQRSVRIIGGYQNNEDVFIEIVPSKEFPNQHALSWAGDTCEVSQ